MGRCVSPCLGDLDPNAYRRQLDLALAPFERPAPARRCCAELDRRMREAAADRRYERAAALLRRRERLAWVLERLEGVLRATHAAPRLVLARHPVKERFDAFWLVRGRLVDWGALPGHAELVERTQAALARPPGRAVVPADEVDEIRIVASWVADGELPELPLDPAPERRRRCCASSGLRLRRRLLCSLLEVLQRALQPRAHVAAAHHRADHPPADAVRLDREVALDEAPPCASASRKRVVTPVPSQLIEISSQFSSRSISSSCSSAPKVPFTTPR